MYSLIAYVLLMSAAAAMAHVNKQPALPGIFLAAHHGPPIVISVQTGLCHPWHGRALAQGKECADLGVHRVVGLKRVSTGPSGLSVPAALDLLRSWPCPLEWDESVAALISGHQVCCLLAEGGWVSKHIALAVALALFTHASPQCMQGKATSISSSSTRTIKSASISTGIWLLPRQVGQHAEFVGVLRGPELAPASMRDLCPSSNKEPLQVGSPGCTHELTCYCTSSISGHQLAPATCIPGTSLLNDWLMPECMAVLLHARMLDCRYRGA
jgi:hypothetical protein